MERVWRKQVFLPTPHIGGDNMLFNFQGKSKSPLCSSLGIFNVICFTSGVTVFKVTV